MGVINHLEEGEGEALIFSVCVGFLGVMSAQETRRSSSSNGEAFIPRGINNFNLLLFL